MEDKELKKVLDSHKKWLRGEYGGIHASIRSADLLGANLQYANLQGAHLPNANLQGAKLWHADLQNVLFPNANLRDAILWHANLVGTNLVGADLRGADIDYSAWPLWCGSLEAYIDDRIAIQLLYHLLRPVQASPYVSQEVKDRLLTEDLIDLANRFHRIGECGEIKR